MPRRTRGAKDHALEIEPAGHFRCGHQVPVVEGVEGASHDTNAQVAQRLAPLAIDPDHHGDDQQADEHSESGQAKHPCGNAGFTAGFAGCENKTVCAHNLTLPRRPWRRSWPKS